VDAVAKAEYSNPGLLSRMQPLKLVHQFGSLQKTMTFSQSCALYLLYLQMEVSSLVSTPPIWRIKPDDDDDDDDD